MHIPIIELWINQLGLSNHSLGNISNYHYHQPPWCEPLTPDGSNQEPVVKIVPIDQISFPGEFPRNISKPNYIDGFLDVKAKKVLTDFFDSTSSMEPIQVHKSTGSSITTPYELHDGYHRFLISKHLGMTHIPIIVVPCLKEFFEGESIQKT